LAASAFNKFSVQCSHFGDCSETPLTLAAIKSSNPQPMMQALVGGGAHLDFRNSQALTAIHRAALNCNPESIKVISLSLVITNK